MRDKIIGSGCLNLDKLPNNYVQNVLGILALGLGLGLKFWIKTELKILTEAKLSGNCVAVTRSFS